MRNMSSGTVLRILCGAALLIVSLAGASSALARPSASGDGKMVPGPRPQEGDIEIAGQPLRILVGPDGSVDVYHQKYSHAASYDPAGFFIAVGQTVYGPIHGN
ncbi:MAG: hypothetical protein NTW99_09605, partial [Chloroflexi bacterium]|nr:hypothetical protein [Chloroflexota bacterium]